MESMSRLVDVLCESSRRNFHNIYDLVAWPERVEPTRDWFMSPELCSLAGTEVWDLLSPEAQKRLAFHEAVNFFSLNIHGESALMQGLAQRLYGLRTRAVSPYLHHFLDEENKHCVLFGTFCERYAGKVYPDRKVVSSATIGDAGQADFLFFAKVLIFEELVDRFNLAMSKDRRLHPIAVAINHNHHVEEARHLAFGRRMCAELWAAGRPAWGPEACAAMRAYLQQFFAVSWKEYYNPDVYRDAGLAAELAGRWDACDPWALQHYGWQHPASRARRLSMSERCMSFLALLGAGPQPENAEHERVP